MTIKSFCALLLMTTAACIPALAHDPVLRARTPIRFPDLPDYLTLKCDFHIHTVFSDGLVWPTVRSEEAWREGLDAIAITDHIEYQPHHADVTTNRNRPYEIASKLGSDLDLIVIHGSEITRQMPPGHINAIFLTNSETLSVPEWRDAVTAAHEQGAFVFWNHPDYPGGKGEIWYPEHADLLDQGMLQGIEVVNGRTYYPKAHRWAIEKNLTLLSNSDIHNALNLDYHVTDGDHRPVTLVFAKARTAEAIHEALLDRRTAVYSGDRLIGDQRFLAPLFERSIHVVTPPLEIKGQERHYVQIHNESDLDYLLERAEELTALQIPATLTLPAHQTVLLEISGRKGQGGGEQTLSLPYRVTNLLVGPDEPLQTRLPLKVCFKSP
jgi:predicted metal-dependent phosphoesterase TrpH